MNNNYKILIVEDVPADAELAEREILKILPQSEFMRVDTRIDFTRALDVFDPDIIVSDFQMPTFDGLSALKIVLDKVPLTPFIILTGSLNEDTAVDCMKAGATDYILKEDIKRIAPALKRALEIKSIKLENLAAQEALIESENRFRRLAENANDLIYRIEYLPSRRFTYVSPSSTIITGYTPEEHYSDANLGFKIVYPDDHSMLEEMAQNPSKLKNKLIFRLVHRSGAIIWVEQISVPIFNDNGELFAIESIARDITERKLAEEALIQNEQRLRSLVEILQIPSSNIEDYLDRSLCEAIKLTASKFGYIYTYDEVTQKFVLNSWSKDVMAECTIVDPMKCYELNSTGLWGEAVRQRKPIIVNDFSAASDLKKGYPEGNVNLKNLIKIK
jgi:PAS domain S-box-containing protein